MDVRTFYKVGIICFLVIALANSYSLYANWSILNIGGKISSISSIVFNFALVLFFNWLRKQLPSVEMEKSMPTKEQMEKLMEELN